MSDRKDLQRLFREQFPRASSEEIEKRVDAHHRRLEQLRIEAQELRAEIEARARNPEGPPWAAAVEPLVLAAVFVLRGASDVETITVKALELSATPHRLGDIRLIIFRLAYRGLLSEHDRSFTITPEGERALAQARDDAKGWIQALGEWPGPATR